MKRFLRHTMFCLVPATLAALVLGVPPAAAQLTLQTVGLSCSDGTPLTVAPGLTELTSRAGPVSAINLVRASDTPPAARLSQHPPPPSSNGPHLEAIGRCRL